MILIDVIVSFHAVFVIEIKFMTGNVKIQFFKWLIYLHSAVKIFQHLISNQL
jgi:hypothetical protein